MKSSFKLAIILFLFVNNVFSQSQLDLIKSFGYQVYRFNNEKLENNITLNKYEALLERDIYKYFDELNQYDSPLSQKIYKTDSIESYKKYTDSLEKVILNLSKSYMYKEFEIYVEKYDLTTHSFKISDVKDDSNIHLNWWVNVKNESIFIPNERIALKIENNRDINNEYSKSRVNALILINEFNKNPKSFSIYYFINDTIIWKTGNNNFVDSVLKKETSFYISSPPSIKKQENPFGSNKSRADYEIKEAKNRILLSTTEPIFAEETGKIVLEVVINAEGKVVKAKISEGTTITDSKILSQTIINVKTQVNYNKSPGASLESQKLSIKVLKK